MMAGSGQFSVPPGFRFHPTDEELLYYYLRKKVSYEAIDLDVIREVDLNKLEPWDLKDGWVVCRVFKKKNHTRCFQAEVAQEEHLNYIKGSASASSSPLVLEPKQNHLQPAVLPLYHDYSFDHGSMHLPQLFSPESSAVGPSFISPLSLNTMDIECSQNLLRLTSTGCGPVHHERFNGDWSFLDKLLASSQQINQFDHHLQNKCNPPSSQVVHDHVATSSQKFPFHYLGCSETDILKFSK
ncbi:hypothetical protein EZV62_006354 [Acer yangbiense]|uniref:NAC domain-containing protein n=1 Tax=Acer yangbiense TaxID=1000413 RepID=A0A5C7IQS9_9ROSI|nr:hypothetical protein EZV62_006354 [Acer yangbiense]